MEGENLRRSEEKRRSEGHERRDYGGSGSAMQRGMYGGHTRNAVACCQKSRNTGAGRRMRKHAAFTLVVTLVVARAQPPKRGDDCGGGWVALSGRRVERARGVHPNQDKTARR